MFAVVFIYIFLFAPIPINAPKKYLILDKKGELSASGVEIENLYKKKSRTPFDIYGQCFCTFLTYILKAIHFLLSQPI